MASGRNAGSFPEQRLVIEPSRGTDTVIFPWKINPCLLLLFYKMFYAFGLFEVIYHSACSKFLNCVCTAFVLLILSLERKKIHTCSGSINEVQ